MKKVSILPPQDDAPTYPISAAALTPMDMLNRAVSSGATPEVLERFMAMHERWEDRENRKAFDGAMASAKAEIPNISKNRTVDFTSAKGRTNYRYEDLGEIARVVNPILGKYGLSYRFRTTAHINEPVSVTCIVSHRDGHFEENTLCAGRDDSGNKNPIQMIGSTLTYLQRMTLKAALGLAASNDDDGKASDNSSTITPEQAANLAAKCEEVAEGFSDSFCSYFKIDAIADLPAKDYQRALVAIGKKKGSAQ
jgi:hypothetical protein